MEWTFQEMIDDEARACMQCGGRRWEEIECCSATERSADDVRIAGERIAECKERDEVGSRCCAVVLRQLRGPVHVRSGQANKPTSGQVTSGARCLVPGDMVLALASMSSLYSTTSCSFHCMHLITHLENAEWRLALAEYMESDS